MSLQSARYLFTTTDFHRMAEARIFKPDDRLELIDGEIITMSPIGGPHMACVNRLAEIFHDRVRPLAVVSVQNPIQLDDYSEPQPDIVLLQRRADLYDAGIPAAAHALLVVEVADTTVQRDRDVKIPAYARALIPETWLVDLISQEVTAYTDPQNGTYQQVRRCRRSEVVVSAALADLAVSVDEILG